MTGVVCTRARFAARIMTMVCALVAWLPASVAAQTDIVLHAERATLRGDWQRVADATAAGGARLWNPDRGQAKLSTPFASPADFFELTFFAEAGRGYRLWVRGRADNNAWTNDSVFVQFSGAVNASGTPIYRIGFAEGAMVSIEEASGRGLSGWGWEDNGWDSLGPLVYFATTGRQTLRVQRREDGISIDQIVLSAGAYVAASPGTTKNDVTILRENTGAPAPVTEIVFGTGNPAAIAGTWRVIDDAGAALGKAVATADTGAPKVSGAAASPTSFAEYTFQADAGRPYRLWLRGRAESNHWGNDSAFVQFSGATTLDGTPVARIGTTGSFTVNLEEASGAGISGWGWQDNGWGTGVLGPLVMFAQSGTQRIRFQTREDGYVIDQVVLSSERYLTIAPGALKNDTTNLLAADAVVAGTGSSSTTAPAPEPAPAPAPAPAPEPAPAPQPAPGTPVRLRLLEWNLHHGVGTDGRYDLDRIATWMARMNPDVVLLNEVEKFTGWGNEDQPERYRTLLEQKTGRRWYSHFSQEWGNWTSHGKGHQILSVYPFDAVGHATITPSEGLKWAGAVSQATITVNGRTLNFLLSHLDPHDQAMRLTQARDVIRYAAGFAENRIIAGDMNAWPDQSSIAELNQTYHDAWTVAASLGTATGVAGITPWGATKKGRIDYIYVSKSASDVAVIDATVVDTRDAAGHMPSDHRPLVVTIEVR
ncbi:MAG TPA: endonuclease/exonuclease/phosphatase family protein [Vicinamibacterales bacterium]|nr:endonuclease/exonuclease/phosphatase family protein [Vicinamibacterales bacterium]